MELNIPTPGQVGWADAVNENWDTIQTALTHTQILSGPLSSLPTATGDNSGNLYFATDDRGGTLYYSDGTNWLQTGAPANVASPQSGQATLSSGTVSFSIVNSPTAFVATYASPSGTLGFLRTSFSFGSLQIDSLDSTGALNTADFSTVYWMAY